MCEESIICRLINAIKRFGRISQGSACNVIHYQRFCYFPYGYPAEFP